jgi:hypothetical protein
MGMRTSLQAASTSRINIGHEASSVKIGSRSVSNACSADSIQPYVGSPLLRTMLQLTPSQNVLEHFQEQASSKFVQPGLLFAHSHIPPPPTPNPNIAVCTTRLQISRKVMYEKVGLNNAGV